MERKKISNWESLLGKMIDHWFLYDGNRLRITGFKRYPNDVEIKTSVREYCFDYEKIKTIFYDFAPIEHDNVPSFDFTAYAEYENMDLMLPTEGLKPETNVNDGLITILAHTIHQHQQQNARFTKAMNKILDELDSPGIPSVHTLKTADTISKLSKDNTNQQLTEIKDLALLQKAIEFKVNNEKQKDEKGNNSNT